MNNKLIIYTAGPISGLSYEECIEHFKRREEILSGYGFLVLTPMLGKEFLRNELKFKSTGYDDSPITTNHAIVKTDFWRVDLSNILHVDFTKAADRVSIGSVAEMSRAFSKDKLIITTMQENNIHQHSFIIEMSSIVFNTVEESFEYLKKYNKYLQ